jgi:preprotein translocase subunit YajC
MTDPTSTWIMLGFLVFMFAVFYLLIIRPQRRRQQEQAQAMAKLQTGDRIITLSGIYGQIESMADDSVVIRIESGALMRIARQAVGYRQSEGPSTPPK